MRDLVSTELDRVDGLDVGQGMFEAYLFGGGTLDDGQVGGALDYSHRINESLSAFTHGEIGYSYGGGGGLGWKATTGFRKRFW